MAWAASAPSGAASPVPAPEPPAPGWNQDWREDFDGDVERNLTRYGWDYQPVNNAAMGRYDPNNALTANGELTLTTRYTEQDGWTSAGVSTGDHFVATGGKWEVRARFDRSEGIGYAFLLWPKDNVWPPEIDFAEGRVNGPRMAGIYHRGTDNQQDEHAVNVPDMTQWHTYGVVVENKCVVYEIDNAEFGRTCNDGVVEAPMWLGLQTGAMDPDGYMKNWETVAGGVPNANTPASSSIHVDWAAHYTR